MLRTMTVVLCLMPLSTAVVAPPAWSAEIYRWVDRNGVLNYSQIRPEGVNAEKVRTRGESSRAASSPAPDPASTTAADEPKLTEEQQRKLDELKTLQQQEEQQIAEIRKTNCEKSRKVLERLNLKEHVRIRNPDGSERTIGEDERQRRIEEAQLGIATNCT